MVKRDIPRISKSGAGPALGLKSNKSRYGGWDIAPCTSLANRLEACDIFSHLITGRFLMLSNTDKMADECEAKTGGAIYVGEGRKSGGYIQSAGIQMTSRFRIEEDLHSVALHLLVRVRPGSS